MSSRSAVSLGATAICALIIASAVTSFASAQEGPNGAINPQRDCQTVLTCNYAKGGSYRGCLSSYSCRTCRFVTARCSIAGGGRKVCRELRCGWGA